MKKYRRWMRYLLLLFVSASLLGLSQIHYEYFHSFIELFDVTVAGCVFFIVWSVRRIDLPAFFLIIGMGQGFVGLLGILHLLSAGAPETATLLKNFARLIDALALLAGGLLYSSTITFFPVFAAFLGGTALLLGTLLYWPTLAGGIQTWMPMYSLVPLVAMAAYAAGCSLLWGRRGSFSPQVLRYLLAAYCLNFTALLLILLRVNIYDMSSALGHLASLAAYLLLAKAMIYITFQEPTDTLLRNLYERDQERKFLMEQLSMEKERYRSLIAQSREALAVIDGVTGEIVEMNRPMSDLTGYTMDMIRGKNTFGIIDLSPEEIAEALKELKEKGVLLPAVRNLRHADGHMLRLERMVSCIEAGKNFIFLYSLRKLSAERCRQESITAEVDYAGFLQRAMQPADFMTHELAVISLWEPLHGVSGDAVAFKWLPEQKRLIGYVMDVTGHGLATALQTAALKALVDLELAGGLWRQSEVLERLNADAAAYFDEGSFAAILLFDFDLRCGLMKCAGAGIYEFIACSGKTNGIVQLAGSFLGILREAEFGYLEFSLAKGDKFYFYTDGVADLLAHHKPELKPGDFPATCNQLKELALSRDRRDDSAGLFVEVKDTDNQQLVEPAESAAILPKGFARFHEQIMRANAQHSVGDILIYSIMAVMSMIQEASAGQIHLYNVQQDVMETRVAVGALQRELYYQCKRGEFLVGRVWENEKTLLVQDYRTWEYRRRGASFDQIHAVVGIPLIASGSVIGVLSVGFDQPRRAFLPEQVMVLETFCSVTSLMLEKLLLIEAQEKEMALFRRNVFARTIAPCMNLVCQDAFPIKTESRTTKPQLDWLDVKLTRLMRPCQGDAAGYVRVKFEPDGRYVRGLLLSSAATVTMNLQNAPECPASIARRTVDIWDQTDVSAMSPREQVFAIHRGLSGERDDAASMPLLVFCIDRQEKILKFASGGIKSFLALTRTLQGIVPLQGNSPGSSALPMVYEYSVPLQQGDTFFFQTSTVLRLIMDVPGFEAADFDELQRRLLWALPQMPHGAGALMFEAGDTGAQSISFEFVHVHQWDIIRKRLRRQLLSHLGPAAVKMEIALGEAISNALRFGPEAGEPLVKVCLKCRTTQNGKNYAVIRVRHYGRPFSGNAVLAKLGLQGADYFREILEHDTGRGLALMKAATDRVVYSATGQEVLLFKRRTTETNGWMG